MKKVMIVGTLEDNNSSLSGPKRVFRSIIENINQATVDYKIINTNKYNTIHILSKVITIKPDIINLFSFGRLNVLLIILARILGIKIIYTAHGIVKKERKLGSSLSKVHELVERFTIHHVDKVVCVSEGLKEMFIDEYKINENNICVIPNAVSNDILTKQVDFNIFDKLNISKEKKVLFTACGSHKLKGILELVDIISKFNRDDIIFVVAGPKGNCHDLLLKYVDNKRIFYLGNLTLSELVSAYKNSYIYIQYSLYETFGLAPFEAMSFGIPAIISENVQLKYLFKGNILENNIVRQNDGVMLKSRINTLLDNKKQYSSLSQQSKFISKKVSWNYIIKNYELLWNSI
ncbi:MULTISPECIES: glycosyltransferase family 4 protein [Heyndrickxia]|uniref:glycosyltransferase family 4 protein n=1 Tax=Heyndrickxia TaxID=2837504 RepID=UPI002DB92DF7|nr:glycosyltransferase family 4 protein [Weizmannia sp. CD-2023]MEC2222767.1 glycosyltransferase family 4 protein [Weizmannia sp. CD-2023]